MSLDSPRDQALNFAAAAGAFAYRHAPTGVDPAEAFRTAFARVLAESGAFTDAAEMLTLTTAHAADYERWMGDR